MNFAPYQDESPEIERALSPPTLDGRVKSPALRSPRASADLPSPSHFAGGGHGNGGYGRDLEGGRASLGAFETSLPIRMDVEAALAYLLLPPAGGLFLLLAEHKSDYVRFHAWQSSMLFAVIFIIHLIFAWSSYISWTLFIIDLALMGSLSMRAYLDVDTLDHFEVPFFGRLANSFVDNE
ncbi:Putative DASH complex subunit duo1 [Penicillium brasilianum]|uniref:Putative DASH complex subunit duo1 n=1 Tax=Penicillium brasilianum TaxID=104259 RepID=A0A0F7TKR4_PENBI|nr:Putative DASH complex subunit duo1 [Penicillium brasilianum]